MTPILIPVRDQLTTLKQLIGWFTKAGEERIYLIDNDSTYPPMVEFLESFPQVLYLHENQGHRSPWNHLEAVRQEYFVVSDPDVVPTEECPLDAIAHLRWILDQIGEPKVGLSLKIDDLPDSYHRKNSVLAWEEQFWKDFKPDLQAYRHPVDTTFALYRPGTPYDLQAMRAAPPYTARHMPWYQDSDNLTDEQQYYAAHADLQYTYWLRNV